MTLKSAFLCIKRISDTEKGSGAKTHQPLFMNLTEVVGNTEEDA